MSTALAILLGSILTSALGFGVSALNSHMQRLENEKDRMFQAEQAQLSFERELSADSNKYQRQVADMKSAGINPMMSVGSAGSVHSQAASGGATATMPLNLGDALTFEQFKLQKAKTEAETANIQANTQKLKSETESTDINNEISRLTKDAIVESRELENQLTRVKMAEGQKALDQMDANISKLVAETETEDKKQSLLDAQRLLANANTTQCVQLIPYQKALMTAQTESQRQAAALSAAHTAYQNGLLSDGYLDAFIRREAAEADSAEAKATLDKIKEALRSGKGLDGILNSPENSLLDKVGSHIVQALTVTLDNLNPLNNIFK